MNADEGEND